MSWNNLSNANLIRVNQQLTVRKSNNQTANKQETYRIKSGDTLSGIARQFDTTVRALKANNNLKSDLIFVGQALRV
jgi:LysM repeat protein